MLWVEFFEINRNAYATSEEPDLQANPRSLIYLCTVRMNVFIFFHACFTYVKVRFRRAPLIKKIFQKTISILMESLDLNYDHCEQYPNFILSFRQLS